MYWSSVLLKIFFFIYSTNKYYSNVILREKFIHCCCTIILVQDSNIKIMRSIISPNAFNFRSIKTATLNSTHRFGLSTDMMNMTLLRACTIIYQICDTHKLFFSESLFPLRLRFGICHSIQMQPSIWIACIMPK